MRALLYRVAALFRSRKLERELEDEIAGHLALQEAEFRASGMTPAQAHSAALREFGGVAQTAEEYREGRGVPWIEHAARDLRYAVRGLVHNPGFAGAAILSLALGIGANTAVFSLFHALMLRMLPVERPQELVSMFRTGGFGRGFISYPLYRQIAERSDLFDGVIARTGVSKVRFTARPGAREEFTQQEFVSGNYFAVLGVAARIGRVFSEEDNRTPGAHPVAVISHDLWANRYGADPAVLGTRVLIGEKPYTIVGVAAPGFHGVEFEHRAEVWTPTMMADMPVNNPRYWWVWVIGRRRSGTSVQQVQAVMDVLMQRHLDSIYPTTYNPAFRKIALGQRLNVRDAGIGLSLMREDFGRALKILMIAVVLVLLAACANVANLLLARGANRRREIAMRLSLGATRGRLIQQALMECVLLVSAGTALGLGIAYWGRQIIMGFLPEQGGDPFSNDSATPVLLFTIAIMAATVPLFGLGPALRSTAVDPALGLRTGGFTRLGGARLRKSLVVAQVAFSVMLVAMATLFGHNLMALREVTLGFQARNVVTFTLDFPREMTEDMRPLMRTISAQLREIPGVTSVSYGFPGPFRMGTSSSTIRVPGSERTYREPAAVDVAQISPQYFETIGTRITAGRMLDDADMTGSRKVAVVNESFVREFFPDEKHPELRRFSFDDSKPEGGEPTFIVGVVGDIRHKGIDSKPRPTVYTPIDQGKNAGGAVMLVRTRAPQNELLRSIYGKLRATRPGIVVTDLRSLGQHVDDSIFEQRVLAAIGGFFGVLALVLAAVGLYGVVAYGTARRTAEIGVRIALGARRGQVVWLIVKESLMLVGIGLAIGMPAALAGTKAVRSLLFDLPPGDPPAMVLTAAALALAGLAAAYLPARRAASVDASRVLRAE